MRLLLIRHALPQRVDAFSDAPDPELSDTGHRQVEAMAQALAGDRIDAVWSSPLRRAVQTAEPLADARGLSINLHPGLVEFDFGYGMYIPAEETDHPVVQKTAQRMADQRGDPEILAFQRTVVSAMGEVIAANPHEATVAVACHGGVVNAFAASVLGIPDVLFGNVFYTGLSWFTVSRSGQIKLVALNEHQHLRALQAASG